MVASVAIATDYSLPADFFIDSKTADIDASLPTIMPPPIIITSSIPKTENPAQSFKLDLQSYSDHYRIGDAISFTIKSERDCYLTVFDIGTTGSTTVLFPNSFRRDNHIVADKVFSLPSEELMPVEVLHLSKPENSITDYETVIAICRLEKRPLFKQPYLFDDYHFHTFSALENWKAQIDKVKSEQEAYAEIRFKIKPAL